MTESEPLEGDERRLAAVDTRGARAGAGMSLFPWADPCPVEAVQALQTCQELPARQAAEEPHGPTSPWASFPG